MPVDQQAIIQGLQRQIKDKDRELRVAQEAARQLVLADAESLRRGRRLASIIELVRKAEQDDGFGVIEEGSLFGQLLQLLDGLDPKKLRRDPRSGGSNE